MTPGRGSLPTLYLPEPSHAYALSSILVTCKHHLVCPKPDFLDYATPSPQGFGAAWDPPPSDLLGSHRPCYQSLLKCLLP